MVKWARLCVLLLFCLSWVRSAWGADARFDLVGPKIDVRVTRGPDTLPIASVPNLQPGDRLWLHPDLPPSQSVKYLLICVFLRGNTNPPPENWFYRIETWNRKVQQEGTFITVPAEAQQALLFMAPETGGDFSTLKSAVRGRPGVFVRASQDLSAAGFEQARIERYLAEIRRVPPADANDLQKHSDLLARTLNLKPNTDCFKKAADQQFACLTQTGSQLLMDDGHSQTVVTALSNGASADFINQASYTQLAGAGTYSAYVGAVVDLLRLLASTHTAQFQYIPAIAFPQGEALNLRLNTPPSFNNPKSVLVIGLPSVQPAAKPPLRPADPNQVACLLKPSVVLPIEGAPLVFSTEFATELVLHLNTPADAPAEPDIPLVADAFDGGLRLEQKPEHHVQITDIRQPLTGASPPPIAAAETADAPATAPIRPSRNAPVTLSGTVQGRWGFDPFTGPTLKLQQLPGSDWHIVGLNGSDTEVIAGKSTELLVASTGSACVHTITAQPPDSHEDIALQFKPETDADLQNRLAVSLPAAHQISPGNLHLEVQQYGQPRPDILATRTFADPAHITAVALAAGDRSLRITGSNLLSIAKFTLGDLVFRPDPESDPASGNANPGNAVPGNSIPPSANPGNSATSGNVGNSVEAADPTLTDALRLSLPPDAPAPPTHAGERLSAKVTLNDGRELAVPVTVAPQRPSIALLSRSFDPSAIAEISLSNPQDLPLVSHIAFTLKSQRDFPRNGRVEIETLDGTLRAVLTLAPSGGLVLQDPRTVVADLDPLRAFGPSAFGALHVRAVFPVGHGRNRHPEPPQPSPERPATGADGSGSPPASEIPEPELDPLTMSDWLPLGTLVRLPVLTHLQCPSDPAGICSLTGSNLYLLQAVSADPAFTHAEPVPDGFTGTTIPVPHPAGSAGTLFFKLRDDPAPIDSAVVPAGSVTTQASATHGHAGATATPR